MNFNFISKLKLKLQREEFLTTPFSMFFSPVYIIRRGLYTSILKFSPKIDGRVLDFGCGTKPYESVFINAKSYLGVDIKVSGNKHKDKVDYFYDGKILPFPDNSFDSIVCFEVLEHVFNIDQVCSEMLRVLKPDGLLLITIPFAWEEHEIPYDFARYSSYGIMHILKRNNFQIIELKKTTTHVQAVGQLFINYVSKYILPRGRILRVLVVFPLNTLVAIINYILPSRYTLFCNLVVFCRNNKDK
jgi:SAM-dependent methyltransferase